MTPARRAVLGIGTATFIPAYGLAPSGERPGDTLLDAALRAGVTYVDTAADYGEGEASVGRVRRGGVRVCTKVPASAGDADVEASVHRLGGPADTILVHSADTERLTSAPAVAALRRARDAGLTARIGASTYGADAANVALAQAWCDAVQVEYSILNQSVVRQLTRRQPDQEVIVRSVLCKGLLTSRRGQAPQLAAPVADALDGLERCARDWRRDLAALAIRFALDTPGVDVVLVGVGSEAELATAVAAAASPALTPEQWQRVAAFDRSDVDVTHPERWTAAP